MMRPGRGGHDEDFVAEIDRLVMLWVTKMTVLPVAAQMRSSSSPMVMAGLRVDRGERLVHQQTRVLHEGAGDAARWRMPPESSCG